MGGEKHMQRGWLRCFLISAFCCCVSISLSAQEVVHAVTGTVASIDQNARTITIKTDDGSEGLFKDLADERIQVDFNPKFRADATAAEEFTDKNARVIVYFIGDADVRTAVALRNLGAGPFTVMTGAVVSFEHGKHTFSMINSSGVVESFKISNNTVVEGSLGAQEGSTFHPTNGDRVQVTATTANGTAEALFVNTMMAN